MECIDRRLASAGTPGDDGLVKQGKSKPVDAEALIERLRVIALALPGASEKLSHGEPAFFVRGKLFATVDNNHHGSGHVAVWCNALPGAQESLVAADPKHFFVPPYVGTKGWLGIRLSSGLAWPVIADLVKQAHEATGVRKPRLL
jgi:hypothetical protein